MISVLLLTFSRGDFVFTIPTPLSEFRSVLSAFPASEFTLTCLKSSTVSVDDASLGLSGRLAVVDSFPDYYGPVSCL
jgi:hypothetical protein